MTSKRTVKKRIENLPTGDKEIWYEVKLQRNKNTLYFVPCKQSSLPQNKEASAKQ
jgi:hypothetical protein